MKPIALLVSLGCGLALFAAPQKKDEPELLLQAAIQAESVDGNLKSAIKQYEMIAARYQGDRRIVATALLHMAECYRKQGDAEAQRIYERVVREYGDQKEAATIARSRLASHDRDLPVARRVWASTASNGSITADGRFLSYVDWDTGDLAIRNLQTGENRRLTNKGTWKDSPDFAEVSSVSANGRQVAYEWYTLTPSEEYFDLRVVSAIGGGAKPRILSRNRSEWGDHIHPVGWLPDGQSVVAYSLRKDHTHQIVLVNTTDGSFKVLKSLDWRSANKLSVSPDGRYVAYDFPPTEESSQRDIYVLAVDGSHETRAVEDAANDLLLGWTPDGKMLLFTSDKTGNTDLWAVAIGDGRPSGRPELIKRNIGGITALGVSSKGALYYELETGIRDVYAVDIDPKSLKPIAEPRSVAQRFLGTNIGPDWSPDGKYLAYASRRGPVWDSPSVICIRSITDGTEPDVMPKLAAMNAYHGIRWSPDGSSILVRGTDRNGRAGLYRINAQTGDTDLVARGTTTPPVWSRDGRTMYFLRAPGQEDAMKIIALNTTDGTERELFRLPIGYFGHLAISPDGKTLGFVDNVDRSFKSQRLLALPTEGGEPRVLVEAPSIAGFAVLAWTPDGEQLLFAKPADRKLALWRVAINTGEQALVTEYPNDGGGFRAARISPDGRRLAYTFGQTRSEVWVLENFLPAATASARN